MIPLGKKITRLLERYEERGREGVSNGRNKSDHWEEVGGCVGWR